MKSTFFYRGWLSRKYRLPPAFFRDTTRCQEAPNFTAGMTSGPHSGPSFCFGRPCAQASGQSTCGAFRSTTTIAPFSAGSSQTLHFPRPIRYFSCRRTTWFTHDHPFTSRTQTMSLRGKYLPRVRTPRLTRLPHHGVKSPGQRSWWLARHPRWILCSMGTVRKSAFCLVPRGSLIQRSSARDQR